MPAMRYWKENRRHIGIPTDRTLLETCNVTEYAKVQLYMYNIRFIYYIVFFGLRVLHASSYISTADEALRVTIVRGININVRRSPTMQGTLHARPNNLSRVPLALYIFKTTLGLYEIPRALAILTNIEMIQVMPDLVYQELPKLMYGPNVCQWRAGTTRTTMSYSDFRVTIERKFDQASDSTWLQDLNSSRGNTRNSERN